jgi:hypothetical protein
MHLEETTKSFTSSKKRTRHFATRHRVSGTFSSWPFRPSEGTADTCLTRSSFCELEVRSRQRERSGSVSRTAALFWPERCYHRKLPRLCDRSARPRVLSSRLTMIWRDSSKSWTPDGRTSPRMNSPLCRVHSGSCPGGNRSSRNGNFSFRAARISIKLCEGDDTTAAAGPHFTLWLESRLGRVSLAGENWQVAAESGDRMPLCFTGLGKFAPGLRVFLEWHRLTSLGE